MSKNQYSFNQIISWLLLFTLILVLFINFPVRPIYPSIHYDSGWLAALNYLPFSQYIAGRDYAFTYGPLAFLFHSTDQDPNKFLSNLFFFCEYLALAFTFWIYRASFLPAKFNFFAIALLLSKFASHNDLRTPAAHDYLPIIFLVLFFSVPLIKQKLSSKLSIFESLLSFLTGILAATLVYIKFDLGIMLLITFGTAIILFPIFKLSYPRQNLLALILGFIFCSICLIPLIFKDLNNLLKWAAASLDVVTAYKNGWTESCPAFFIFYIGITLLLLYLILVLISAFKRQQLGFFSLILLPTVLISFMHGFILEEPWHMSSFFKYVLVASAFLSIFSTFRTKILLSFIYLPALVCVIALDCLQDMRWTSIETTAAFESMRLSNLPKDLINGKSCDGVPANLMWCFANHLNYQPNPFITLALACTQKTDNKIANYYSSAQAPDYIFCEFCTMCQKNMFWDTPETWRSILNNYCLVNYDANKQVLLLKKQTKPKAQITLGEKFLCSNEIWYKVPKNKNMLYGAFYMQPTLIGKLLNFIYKVPPVYLNIKYLDGQIHTYKLISSVSNSGILINYLPTDLYALSQMFNNKANNVVTEFAITGPGLKYIETPIQSQWICEEKSISFVPEIISCSSLTKPHIEVSNNKQPFICFLSVETTNKDPSAAFSIETNTFEKVKYPPPPHYSPKDKLLLLNLVAFKSHTNLIPAKSLFLQIDNQSLLKTAPRIVTVKRVGISKSREELTAAFARSVSISDLKPGPHSLSVLIDNGDEKGLYKFNKLFQFVID